MCKTRLILVYGNYYFDKSKHKTKHIFKKKFLEIS